MSMDYQSNSKKSKEKAAKTAEGEVEKKEVKRIVSGEVTKRKTPLGRRFTSMFSGGDDAQSVGQYILLDVVIPAIKSMIYDSFTQGLERSLFGTSSAKSRGSHGNGKHTSYNKMYPGRNFETDGGRTLSKKDRALHNFGDIIIGTRSEAEEVMDHLQFLIDEYDVATLNDLYDLVGITGDPVDEKWGWTTLSDCGVRRIRDGYLLDLTKPVWLE